MRPFKAAKARQKSSKPSPFIETAPGRPESPLFLASDDEHPGLKGFWSWCDTEASLFRIYCLGRTDGQDVVPPYNPSSKRGQVQIKLQIQNHLNYPIQVFWVNYKGREEPKGEIRPNMYWHQFTWIDHPWVFRNSNRLLLHYIPYRVIPTCVVQPTVEDGVGLHRFAIGPPNAEPFACRIDDPVFPFPSHLHQLLPTQCMEWTLLHCHRMGWRGWDVWIKYLTKMVQDPKNTKVRRIRQANSIFASQVWLTSAKGLVYAAGMIEHGGVVELGSAEPLSRERMQELNQWLMMTQRWKEYSLGQGDIVMQPEGADGFGRAGFGRVG